MAFNGNRSSRNFTFSLSDPSAVEAFKIRAKYQLERGKINYITFQHEKEPAIIFGFMQFTRSQRLGFAYNLFSFPRLYFNIAVGCADIHKSVILDAKTRMPGTEVFELGRMNALKGDIAQIIKDVENNLRKEEAIIVDSSPSPVTPATTSPTSPGVVEVPATEPMEAANAIVALSSPTPSPSPEISLPPKKKWPPSFVIPLLHWPKEFVMLICGITSLGRTEFALSHFDKPLRVRQMDDLIQFDPLAYDGLVFDNMDFRKLSFERRKALVERRSRSAIIIGNSIIFIPQYYPTIFTNTMSNIFEDDPFLFSKVPTPPLIMDSIRNRLHIVEFTQTLYKADK